MKELLDYTEVYKSIIIIIIIIVVVVINLFVVILFVHELSFMLFYMQGFCHSLWVCLLKRPSN